MKIVEPGKPCERCTQINENGVCTAKHLTGFVYTDKNGEKVFQICKETLKFNRR